MPLTVDTPTAPPLELLRSQIKQDLAGLGIPALRISIEILVADDLFEKLSEQHSDDVDAVGDLVLGRGSVFLAVIPESHKR